MRIKNKLVFLLSKSKVLYRKLSIFMKYIGNICKKIHILKTIMRLIAKMDKHTHMYDTFLYKNNVLIYTIRKSIIKK
jgi:hypothetical protein